ncbi:MAG TPA: N-acetylglucosamine-6-phosphate deacetylase [Acidimicrobiia bacterium]|nr:N-acetylglucosamine-6-phosphate deacetylase [Acidimicrobiia bacterium]
MKGPFPGMEGRVLPGFVDLQVNGGYGHDFTADPASIWIVAGHLLRHGVTAFLPTIISSPPEVAEAAFAVLAEPPPGWVGARPLGLHVEGPAISQVRRGVHPAEALTEPSIAWADRLLTAGPPAMVTLAPELAGAEAVARRLADAGVKVAIGHTDASAAQAETAFGWGMTHATHLFNAMSGLHHRTPGAAAAVLAHDSVTVGLIADGVHVSDVMLRLAWKALGPQRLALVSDAMAAAGMGEGCFRLGPAVATAAEGAVRDSEGRLAGSMALMDGVIRVMARATGCTLADLAAMASTTPAAIVGHSPDPGDAVLVDDQMAVVSTALAGEIAYRRDAS